MKLLERFKDVSILVLGDFMLDEYVMGTVDRISPEAPVPVVLERTRKHMPGGAGNVVCNLAALGARAILVGVVGPDEARAKLAEMFAALGVRPEEMALLESANRPTTRKTRILAGNQQVCRLDTERAGPIDAAEENRLVEFIEAKLDRVRAVIFSDYDKGVITPGILKRTVAAARARNVFLAVDPQVTHFHYYQNVHVLTPNHHEAGRFLGRKLIEDTEVQLGGFEILDRLSSEMLLITRGEKGMTLFEARNRACRQFPTRAREVFDVTGAGDTVISIFTLAMAAGGTPEEAVELSNRGAGIVVGKLGAATVTAEELMNAEGLSG